MKFVARHDQSRLVRYAIKRWRKDLKRKLTIAVTERSRPATAAAVTRITPPSVFSFSANYDATIMFLQEFKKAVFATDAVGKPAPFFLDLSTMKSISVAGALVLGAETHRWRRHRRSRLKASNIRDWHPKVRRVLASLGFFKMLRMKVPKRLVADELGHEITVLPMVSSTELDARLLHMTLERLNTVAEILDQDPLIYGALVEAAYNAKLHAYPDDFEYEYVPTIKGWWATASWSPEAGVVKFLVYDQGVGIPATLPRWQGWEQLRAWLATNLGPVAVGLKDASNLIAAAIEMDRTSLDGGHGKGLQDVIAVVETTARSSVRILSGTGSVIYRCGGHIEKQDHSLHIGGTLIEWRIPVGTHERG